MFPTTRIVTQRACSRSLKGVHPMPRRAFRNDVSRCRHFGGVIQYSWTRAAPSAASSRCPCRATPARSGGRRSVHGLLVPPGPPQRRRRPTGPPGQCGVAWGCVCRLRASRGTPLFQPAVHTELVGRRDVVLAPGTAHGLLRSFQPNFLTGFCHQKLRAGELTGPCHLLEPPIPVGVAKPLSMMLVY